MDSESFKDFKRKYENKLNEDEVINLLLDDKVRNYVIENDDFNFLALIAASNNDNLRNFYYNEKTIPYINQLDKMSGVLFRSNFYPNKIKLFDNEVFLEHLTYGNNTFHTVTEIKEEIKKNSDNIELVNTLKAGLYKYFNYLQRDFKANIKAISVFMSDVYEQYYMEFFNLILDDLKQLAIDNKEMSFDEIFSNYYFTMNSTSFDDIRFIVNKFINIDNIYYSPVLIRTLIEKSAKFID